MRGAIVFLATFFLFLIITLGYRGLPPGEAIYDAVVGEESDYLVAGIPITHLAIAVFNGVIYGVIVFFIYWLADKFIFSKRKATLEIKQA
ncbi:MAG: hypothetical protein JSV51_01570 [Candidatus Bathyarchaeota archaeon]|nr:MAG: hypothetical protein JSV51_01570 [Candidatus Bathyarchaeota archaeon]